MAPVVSAVLVAAVAGACSSAPSGGGKPDRAGGPAGQPPVSRAGAAPSPAKRSPGAVVAGRRQPVKVAVPHAASGRYVTVPGAAAPPGGSRGPVVRYSVQMERGLPFDAAAFAAEVHRVLNDPRSWGHGGAMRFQRVAGGPVRFVVALSSPALTDRLCLPLRTGGELSCRSGIRSIINARRWGIGAPTYGRDLATYREYVINHEVGHALGHGHQQCPGPGRRAPVMVQQTKSLQGCRPNPWPFPG
ncbi:DUF3152 domain-containing protein [Actinomadura macrotermitis]|uniref:DUF3152 domain-containing protein n=1 Tax=Actinomadura macrotermitis TaxID=2585200 RepID=UPI002E2650D2